MVSADPTREERVAAPKRDVARLALLSIAVLKTALVAAGALFALVLSGGQDPAGRGMLAGFSVFALLYWVLFVLPALLFARRGTRIKLGFGLILVPDLLAAAAAFVL